MTQNERIKEYLEKHGSITPREADRELGIMRLSARVLELRADGLNIRTEKETSRNKYGESVSYARYVLVKK